MNDSTVRVMDCAECGRPAEAPHARIVDPYGLPTNLVVCLECRGLILDDHPAAD